ncbi:GTPase Era [Calditrichota bacterium]
MIDKKNYKAGYIAIIGKPNVGKSTLMNNLLDIKLSITSPRPQTTRRRVMGILNKESLQIIFLDTPGILAPKYGLQREMMHHVSMAVTDADVLIYMLEVNSRNIENGIDIENLQKVNPSGKPVLLVINKVDIISKPDLLPIIKYYSDKYDFESILPISALKKDGIDELLQFFYKHIPLHPPFYDVDILTDQPEKFFVAELIREQVFYQFQKEIPYSTEVQILEFKERERGKDYISAVIFVERDSQKAILIGQRGEALKNLSKRSRLSIEKFLDCSIYLEIIIKVKKNWRKDEQQLKQFGY